MRRISLVRRRDGQVVPFDEASIEEAVHRALLASGRDDRILAGEIASVVTLFLDKSLGLDDDVPTVADVEEMVEKVLIETGQAAAAKAYILRRERDARLRDAAAFRSEPAPPLLFPGEAAAIPVTIDDPFAGESAPYSRERLARRLLAEGGISRGDADLVAAAVETRLRKLGVTRVSSSWIRAVAEVELLERGGAADLRRRPGVLLDTETLSAALHGRGGETSEFPSTAARRLGAMALGAHALADLLPFDVARAHLEGAIHVHGLGDPGALIGIAIDGADVAEGAAPGSAARDAAGSGDSPRRFCASLGRVARLARSAARQVVVTGACDAIAAAASGATTAAAPSTTTPAKSSSSKSVRESWADDAWHLVLELSADEPGSRTVLDLAPRAGADPAYVAVIHRIAAAVVRAIASGSGLPSRELLPQVRVPVDRATLDQPDGRALLTAAAELARQGGAVVFGLDRRTDGAGEAAHSGPKSSGERAAPARFSDPATAWDHACPESGGAAQRRSGLCAGSVTLNLAVAARDAGRGHVEPFLRACDRLVDLAALAHRTRREFLAQVATASGGTIAPFFRAVRGRRPFLDLSTATWETGIAGLNEALVYLTGFELHEGDESVVRTAQRIVSYLGVRVREASAQSDLRGALVADEDPAVATRFHRLDLRTAPDRTMNSLGAVSSYSSGVGCRSGAPVDALLRLDREDPLHAPTTRAVFRLDVPQQDRVATQGFLALLEKARSGGAIRAVEVASW